MKPARRFLTSTNYLNCDSTTQSHTSTRMDSKAILIGPFGERVGKGLSGVFVVEMLLQPWSLAHYGTDGLSCSKRSHGEGRRPITHMGFLVVLWKVCLQTSHWIDWAA